jgi:hypothetical protein
MDKDKIKMEIDSIITQRRDLLKVLQQVKLSLIYILLRLILFW